MAHRTVIWRHEKYDANGNLIWVDSPKAKCTGCGQVLQSTERYDAKELRDLENGESWTCDCRS